MGDLFSLKDRVAIVTGSTRGIGFATARLMGRAGAKIVISSRKPAACDEVAARLAALRTIGEVPRRLDLLPTRPLPTSED